MASPSSNFGLLSTLEMDGGTGEFQETYVRFTVSSLTGQVQSAMLRLYVTNGSTNGPALYGTSNSWSETGITWNNRPARSTGIIDNKGSVPLNTWVEYIVTPLVSGDGTYSFVLANTSTDALHANSRNASINRPELVVTMVP